MGRKPCCDKVGLKKGPWTAEEDKRLINFILTNGQCCWRAVPKLAGILRCGKSCRLRWTNYLRPDLKRGLLSEDEEKIVIDLHAQLGNRWSKIAAQLPGRTDNEIKNHWNTHIKKKLKKSGIDPLTHMPLSLSPVFPEPHLESKLLEEADFIETSIHSTITHGKEEEENNKCKKTDSMQLVNINDFSIDEVPLADPCEILDSIISPPSSSSSSSSCSSTSCVPASAYVVEEDLDILPSFNWQCDFSENMCFWDDYYFINTLSFLLEDDHFDKNLDVQLQPPLP